MMSCIQMSGVTPSHAESRMKVRPESCLHTNESYGMGLSGSVHVNE